MVSPTERNISVETVNKIGSYEKESQLKILQHCSGVELGSPKLVALTDVTNLYRARSILKRAEMKLDKLSSDSSKQAEQELMTDVSSAKTVIQLTLNQIGINELTIPGYSSSYDYLHKEASSLGAKIGNELGDIEDWQYLVFGCFDGARRTLIQSIA